MILPGAERTRATKLKNAHVRNKRDVGNFDRRVVRARVCGKSEVVIDVRTNGISATGNCGGIEVCRARNPCARHHDPATRRGVTRRDPFGRCHRRVAQVVPRAARSCDVNKRVRARSRSAFRRRAIDDDGWNSHRRTRTDALGTRGRQGDQTRADAQPN